MEFEITIKFNLNNDIYDVPAEKRSALEEKCREHIFFSLNEGYTSGELHEELDSVEYHGWWEFNTKVIK